MPFRRVPRHKAVKRVVQKVKREGKRVIQPGLSEIKEHGRGTPWWMISVTEDDLYPDGDLSAPFGEYEDPALDDLVRELEEEWKR